VEVADRGEVQLQDLTVVTDTKGRSVAPPPVGDVDEPVVCFDPGRVLADRDGCAALTELVGRLRTIGYDGSPYASENDATRADVSARTLIALARREPTTRHDVVGALGVDAVSALIRCGALALVDEDVLLTAKVFPMRSLYTLLPGTPPGQDTVYLGPDSLVLFEIVWAARGFGDHAADLATGNGFLAAALATRYDHVVAADLSSRCVSTAGLVPVVNPHLRTRFAAVQLDVAEGLRPGSFDLVTANPPWVPETIAPKGDQPRRFAAGGPTGFELPRRFIDAAAELLAPGGKAFIACMDIAFDNGHRPLAEHLPRLAAHGVGATVVETRLNQTFDYDPRAARKAPRAASARHVVVELRRPS